MSTMHRRGQEFESPILHLQLIDIARDGAADFEKSGVVAEEHRIASAYEWTGIHKPMDS